MNIQLYLEGHDAEIASRQLLQALPDSQLQHSEPTRGMDWVGVIEVAGSAIGAVGGIVSMAHTIWQWKQTHAKENKTILQKSEETRKSRLILDDTVTPEDIANFLK